MSVLVKGVEMPTRCFACPMCDVENAEVNCAISHGCYIEYREVDPKVAMQDRPEWCPLIEVPPHGRLIDADALMLRIQEYIDEYGWDVDEHGFHSEKWCAMKETEMAINDAPTVIEAESYSERELQRDYEASVEYAQHCGRYEPTYDPDTGAM